MPEWKLQTVLNNWCGCYEPHPYHCADVTVICKPAVCSNSIEIWAKCLLVCKGMSVSQKAWVHLMSNIPFEKTSSQPNKCKRKKIKIRKRWGFSGVRTAQMDSEPFIFALFSKTLFLSQTSHQFNTMLIHRPETPKKKIMLHRKNIIIWKGPCLWCNFFPNMFKYSYKILV